MYGEADKDVHATLKKMETLMLQDYCHAKLGRLDRHIQLRSFEEVKAHNAAGQSWLILDGRHPDCCSLIHACKHTKHADECRRTAMKASVACSS